MKPIFALSFLSLLALAGCSQHSHTPASAAASTVETRAPAASAAATAATPSLASSPASPSTTAPSPTEAGPVKALIRYPTLHGNDIVFEAGGDLWKTTVQGGVATQLTDDSGFDMAPHYSPDGKWIAFTGWYQGNTDVYLIAANGGPVKRLTYHSINTRTPTGQLKPALDNIVLGWTPNGKDVVFLSRRNSFNPQVMHAYTVPVTGGLPTQLPIPWTGPLSFGPKPDEVAYNKLSRVLRPFHRKRYYAGQAQKIWTFNFKTGKSRQITFWKGASVWPMWDGDMLYFTSDRGANGVQNLWSYSFTTNTFAQVTHFDTYDVDWPTLGNDGIALSDGGDLYVYLFSDHKLHRVHVRVPTNGLALQPHWVDAAKRVTSASLAPSGKLAVFSAAGALFTVPAKFGSTETLTHNPADDERDPAWSPNGKQIAFILAQGDSEEIAVKPAGGGATKLLTHTNDVSYQQPITWSPNSQWITYVDSHQNLWLQNVKSGKQIKVTTDLSSRFTFTDLSWSPGSDWVAFSKTLPDQMSAIYLYHLTDHSLHQLGSGRFNDSNPVFSRNGKYLFFTSVRITNPAVGAFDNNVLAGLDADGLYAATLQAKTPSPLAPRVRSAAPKPANPPAGGKPHPKPAAHTGPVTVDLKDLMARAVQLPVPAGNITGIAAAHGLVFYSTGPIQVMGGSVPGVKPELRAYNVAKRESHTLVTGINGFMLSADGSTLLYKAKDKWQVRPANFNPKAKPEPLNLAHVRRWVEPRAEWNTIFGEAWRNVRDYFFNPELVKKEWGTFGDRYRRLLPYAASRNDVNWLIGNMIGSFGESHMYIRGGDMGWKSPAAPSADLGANFVLDAKSGRYQIARIYHGNNTLPGYAAPLAQPGLKVAAGDYILAINGTPLKAPMNPYELLLGTYGTTVRLQLSAKPAGTGAWTIRVKPVANAAKLHLLAWIRHNRAEVTKLSGGKIGYVYLNDFEATGMHEFMRQYYSQMRKQAIIIDDRWNLGGSNVVENAIFDRVARRLVAMTTTRRGWVLPYNFAYGGYMAVLMNRGSASNGDIFPYMFKQAHLGPVIGSRSWGGVRGYDGPFRLMDGGGQAVSDIGMYGMHSQWVVENIGVEPDIKVHDEPGAWNKGTDTQLKTAVDVLLKKIAAKPGTLPPPPPWRPAFPPQPNYPACTDKPNTQTCGTQSAG
ncbi:MAG TPA: S41 family peptidase [Rhodanobacteraceae bacterium]